MKANAKANEYTSVQEFAKRKDLSDVDYQFLVSVIRFYKRKKMMPNTKKIGKRMYYKEEELKKIITHIKSIQFQTNNE